MLRSALSSARTAACQRLVVASYSSCKLACNPTFFGAFSQSMCKLWPKVVRVWTLGTGQAQIIAWQRVVVYTSVTVIVIANQRPIS